MGEEVVIPVPKRRWLVYAGILITIVLVGALIWVIAIPRIPIAVVYRGSFILTLGGEPYFEGAPLPSKISYRILDDEETLLASGTLVPPDYLAKIEGETKEGYCWVNLNATGWYWMHEFIEAITRGGITYYKLVIRSAKPSYYASFADVGNASIISLEGRTGLGTADNYFTVNHNVSLESYGLFKNFTIVISSNASVNDVWVLETSSFAGIEIKPMLADGKWVASFGDIGNELGVDVFHLNAEYWHVKLDPATTRIANTLEIYCTDELGNRILLASGTFNFDA